MNLKAYSEKCYHLDYVYKYCILLKTCDPFFNFCILPADAAWADVQWRREGAFLDLFIDRGAPQARRQHYFFYEH